MSDIYILLVSDVCFSSWP
jgi:hypothetical protein